MRVQFWPLSVVLKSPRNVLSAAAIPAKRVAGLEGAIASSMVRTFEEGRTFAPVPLICDQVIPPSLDRYTPLPCNEAYAILPFVGSKNALLAVPARVWIAVQVM